MKLRYYKILLLIGALFIFSECEEKLDLAPLGELNSESYYKNESDFDAAMMSPYSTLLNFYYDQFGSGFLRPVMLASDDLRDERGETKEEEIFNWTPGNGRFRNIWDESYKGIMRANVILDRLPEADNFGDEDNKARFEAEAKFLRGYFHFILARHFGNPPVINELIRSLDESRKPNSEIGEIWDLIEADFRFAADNLPESWGEDNKGRVTSWTGKAFFGKAQIFRAQWLNEPGKYSDALTNLNDVINNGPYQLLSDFGDNFLQSAENNAESVFEIQFSRGDFNPWLPVDFGLSLGSNAGAAGTGRKIFTGASCDNESCAPGGNVHGYGVVLPMQSLVDAFEPNDARRVQTVYVPGDMYTEDKAYDPSWSFTGYNIAKYIKPFVPSGFPPNWSGNNERVMRYSEVLLLAAEAETLAPNGNLARAAELLNRVRERARNYYEVWYGEAAPAGTLPDRPSNVSEEQMMDWIINERRVELAFELKRYDDLVRWHRAGIIDIATDIDFGNELANNNWDERHLLKPIPQRELDNNPNLQQHSEYLQ
jgi:starch-binding outer membrane protein, SusD/RagB family